MSGFMGKEENMKQRPWWKWKQFLAICFREPQETARKAIKIMIAHPGNGIWWSGVGCGGGRKSGTGSHITPKHEKSVQGQGAYHPSKSSFPRAKGAPGSETLLTTPSGHLQTTETQSCARGGTNRTHNLLVWREGGTRDQKRKQHVGLCHTWPCLPATNPRIRTREQNRTQKVISPKSNNLQVRKLKSRVGEWLSYGNSGNWSLSWHRAWSPHSWPRALPYLWIFQRPQCMNNPPRRTVIKLSVDLTQGRGCNWISPPNLLVDEKDSYFLLFICIAWLRALGRLTLCFGKDVDTSRSLLWVTGFPLKFPGCNSTVPTADLSLSPLLNRLRWGS